MKRNAHLILALTAATAALTAAAWFLWVKKFQSPIQIPDIRQNQPPTIAIETPPSPAMATPPKLSAPRQEKSPDPKINPMILPQKTAPETIPLDGPALLAPEENDTCGPKKKESCGGELEKIPSNSPF
ncbi:MAG: hypothetical protein HY547_09335 [Elusimicrobia bacterium]|nr:hypothetical protein [Elusimicrobiota bacterium]